MLCLVHVKFMPEGSVSPDEFFACLNAKWFYYGALDDAVAPNPAPESAECKTSCKEAFCLTDYESIQQLAVDLVIMPGAGIANIEVFPLSGQRQGHPVVSPPTK